MTFSESIKEFLLHCEYEKKLNAKTLKAYKIDLKQFQGFINDLQIADISKYLIKEYLTNISSYKPSSLKRKIATLKALFNYLEFEDKLLINPFRKIKISIKNQQKIRTTLDINEIASLYNTTFDIKPYKLENSAYKNFTLLRNAVILELLFNTGARVSEISNIKTINFDRINGSIKIHGKGNKERIIQICQNEALSLLRKYDLELKIIFGDKQKWFLVNRNRNKLSEQSIRNIVKKMSDKAGISKHITPHIFRHTFATLLLEKDVDIRYIQILLGHSSITTTQIYTHVTQKKQREILKLKHPRNEILNKIDWCIEDN